MTDHEQIIYKIISSSLSYSGSYYPNRRVLNTPTAGNPDFIVWVAEPIAETNTMYAEKFKVYFKAATRTELQTIKTAMLSLSSGAVSGYPTLDSTFNCVLSSNLDDGKFNFTSGMLNSVISNPNTVGAYLSESNAIADEVYLFYTDASNNQVLYCKFALDSNFDILLSQTMKLILHATSTVVNKTLRVYGLKYVNIGTINPDITNFVVTTAYVDYNGSWDDGDDIEIDVSEVFEEIKSITDFEKDNFGFLVCSGDAYAGCSTFKIWKEGIAFSEDYAKIDCEQVFSSDYPFWIEVRGGNPNFNENEFEIEFEIEARWAL